MHVVVICQQVLTVGDTTAVQTCIIVIIGQRRSPQRVYSEVGVI